MSRTFVDNSSFNTINMTESRRNPHQTDYLGCHCGTSQRVFNVGLHTLCNSVVNSTRDGVNGQDEFANKVPTVKLTFTEFFIFTFASTKYVIFTRYILQNVLKFKENCNSLIFKSMKQKKLR